MAARNYLRKARIEIGVRGSTLTVADLRITFEARLTLGANRVARASIWNLASRTTERVREQREKMRIIAGYADRMHVVWYGDIARVEHERRGNDRVTTLESAGTLDTEYVELSIEGPIGLKTVVQRLASLGGLVMGPLDALPDETLDGAVWTGTATAGLTHFLGGRGLQWYEVSGEIMLSRTGEALASGAARTISEETGMVGSPTLTDDGAEVVVLLDPTYELDGVVRIQSNSLKGAFRIAGIEHRGDTWSSGVWQTKLDLRHG